MSLRQWSSRLLTISSVAALSFSLAARSYGAEHANIAGIWILDTARSTGAIPQYSSLSIGQNAHWFRSAQLDQNGRTERTVESECQIDGRFHPVSGGHGGSIRCKWDGSVLLSEEHWNNAQNQRVTRTSLAPDGTLLQDIQTTGAGSPGATTHLVWKRRE